MNKRKRCRWKKVGAIAYIDCMITYVIDVWTIPLLCPFCGKKTKEKT